jgi:membrane dipeptidase
MQRRRVMQGALLVSILFMAIASARQPARRDVISERARRVHSEAIVIDTHADTPQRLVFDRSFDIGARNITGHIDIPRMREGGTDAEFFSIWVSGDITGPPAVKRALDQIDAVREAARLHPDDLVLATTAREIRQAAARKQIAALMGVEGGHMIDDDLRILRVYASLGVRYLTLTHFKNNNWADSSTDKPAHDGLTGFGRDVIRELNRLGVMVDVSHVSDKTFHDAIALSRAPVIASHSSCRSIANHPRNMSDSMMLALAKNGGVVMINYELSFLSEEFRKAQAAAGNDVTTQLQKVEAQCKGDDACVTVTMNRISRELMESGKMPRVTWEKIIDHIDHAAKVAGIDHVGLGSDFDGATMPIGMEDASKQPRITEALLARGYSEQDVTKILGGNLLRVMERNEEVSRNLAPPPGTGRPATPARQ